MIRNAGEHDVGTIRGLLEKENMRPEDSDVFANPDTKTMVWEEGGVVKGFFSYRFEHGLPFLNHFLVAKEFRSINSARFLVKAFEAVVRNLGFKKAIVHTFADRPRYQAMLVHYFRKPFYDQKDGSRFMLVEV